MGARPVPMAPPVLALAASLVLGCHGEPGPADASPGRTDASADAGRRDVAPSDAGGADAAANDAGEAPPVDASHERDAGPEAGPPDASGSDASFDGGPAPCVLTSSPPIVVETDGAVIEHLRIEADGEPAITVRARNVTLRNLHIRHRGGPGIMAREADDLLIEGVFVEYLDAPDSGPNPSTEHTNIDVYRSARLRVDGARLHRGSSGVYLVESPGASLRRIEGFDFRGPYPRGQVVQFNASSDGLLEDFSVVSPPGSWPEDNVNVFRSTNVTIRRGFIDGNNAPTGVGVIFDGGDSTGRVEDVDAVRMGNGCFSAYDGGDGSVFVRTRCRDNICEDQGRGAPTSNGLMWAGRPGLSALRLEEAQWFDACNRGNIVWPRDSFATAELAEVDFTPRAAIEVLLCWE